MYHTLKRAWQEIGELSSDNVSEIAQRFAYGALMGARGNSGTISLAIAEGICGWIGRRGDVRTFVGNFSLSPARAAVELAYAAVCKAS